MRNILLFGFFIFLFMACSAGQDEFVRMLSDLKDSQKTQRESKIEKYIRAQREIPVKKDSVVYFVFKNNSEKTVYLSGDMTSWKPDSLPMKHIVGTMYWYIRQVYPTDSRLEYKFVLDKKYLLDPLNPLRDRGGYGYNSVLTMPDYHFPQEILLRKKSGVTPLDSIQFESKFLHNQREILFYHHPSAGPNAPLILFNDGQDYLQLAGANIILDNLIGQNQIPALKAVFINPVKRMHEYGLDDAYLKMVFKELLPFLKKEKHISGREPLFMGGASLGGLTALYSLKDYQRSLSGIFAQSASIWVEQEKVLDVLKATSFKKGLRIYSDYGTFENQQVVQTRLQKILQKKNVLFEIKPFHEGHNWGNWRAHLSGALTFLLTR